MWLVSGAAASLQTQQGPSCLPAPQAAAAKLPPSALPTGLSCCWVQGDIAALPSTTDLGGPFDFIALSAGSFHHLLTAEAQLACLSGVRRLLAGGGASRAVLNIFPASHLRVGAALRLARQQHAKHLAAAAFSPCVASTCAVGQQEQFLNGPTLPSAGERGASHDGGELPQVWAAPLCFTAAVPPCGCASHPGATCTSPLVGGVQASRCSEELPR